MAPCAAHAVEFAQRVVQETIGGARCARRGEVADHGVECEGRFDVRVFEPAVEQIGDGLQEQVSQVATTFHRQP